jgi:hypothetical protein
MGLLTRAPQLTQNRPRACIRERNPNRTHSLRTDTSALRSQHRCFSVLVASLEVGSLMGEAPPPLIHIFELLAIGNHRAGGGADPVFAPSEAASTGAVGCSSWWVAYKLRQYNTFSAWRGVYVSWLRAAASTKGRGSHDYGLPWPGIWNVALSMGKAYFRRLCCDGPFHIMTRND